ncbi:MAG TPA: hypothetical protein VK196_15605 [Magnetospirillum sp.]|nr:hypothetical protein [Magnetospirillum sp.]
MTFDFTPGWLDTMSNATDTATPMPRHSHAATAVRAAVAACPPPQPTMAQVASLVGELFAEGTLSFEQLCSLSNAPEMASLLDDTVAGVTPARRNGAARR